MTLMMNRFLVQETPVFTRKTLSKFDLVAPMYSGDISSSQCIRLAAENF